MFLFADTNILLDLEKIKLLREFFRTKNEVYMEESLFQDELIEPEHIKELLTTYGLKCVEMTNQEFILAQRVCEENSGLSIYDSIAFAVAKSRNWILLTGDRKLRKYAESHSVEVKGLLWTVDECVQNGTSYDWIFKSLNVVLSNSKIRVPNELVVNRKIRYMVAAYKECFKTTRKKDWMYYINDNTYMVVECMSA